MTNQGSLKLDEGDVPVEVMPMPITMLYVTPSEITIEVSKALEKQHRATYGWAALSVALSALATLVTTENFGSVVFSGAVWHAFFALLFGFSVIVAIYQLIFRKGMMPVDPEEVSNRLIEKIQAKKRVQAIDPTVSTDAFQ